MASISLRNNEDGTIAYRASIRRKGISIEKTFRLKEDAEAFAFYKENLIDNMHAFDVPISERIKLETIVQMKVEMMSSSERRSSMDISNSFKTISQVIDINKYLYLFTYDDWLAATKKLFHTHVHRGVKEEHTKRTPSIATVRRHIASLSSCFSYAIGQGINLENLPLKVMQTFINPLMKGTIFLDP